MPGGQLTAGEYAAQYGKGLNKWVNAKTASGSEEVLTDATLYYDLKDGEVVMVECICFDIETPSDDCTFELVRCSAIAGGGTPTAISGQVHAFTSTAQSQGVSRMRIMHPPIRAAYADGARSITLRINGNDNAAVVSCGWMGYVDITFPSKKS